MRHALAARQCQTEQLGAASASSQLEVTGPQVAAASTCMMSCCNPRCCAMIGCSDQSPEQRLLRNTTTCTKDCRARLSGAFYLLLSPTCSVRCCCHRQRAVHMTRSGSYHVSCHRLHLPASPLRRRLQPRCSIVSHHLKSLLNAAAPHSANRLGAVTTGAQRPPASGCTTVAGTLDVSRLTVTIATSLSRLISR